MDMRTILQGANGVAETAKWARTKWSRQVSCSLRTVLANFPAVAQIGVE